MIRRLVCTVALTGLCVAGLAATAAAQLEPNLGALTEENAKGYLGPLTGALSTTMNSAVFHSGYVPKTGLNFEIGAHVMGMTFDDEDRLYVPANPPGYEDIDDVDAPTVIGDTKSVTVVGNAQQEITYPGGFDIENFTVAAPQLMIGSVAGTRAVVRWVSFDLGDTDLGKFSLWGVGAQHSITQYFQNAPVDVAVGFLYQQFKIGDDDLLDANMFHVNVTGSKRFGVLEPYVGLGLDSFSLKTKYDTDSSPDEEDLFEVEFDNETNEHITLGVRASLAFVMAHAEFNMAAETGVAVGLSFGTSGGQAQ